MSNSPLIDLGMALARVNKKSYSFTLHPHIYLQAE